MSRKAGAEKQGFEKSLERLEEIVAEMEAGKLSLEDMIARFEEGQALVTQCTKKLNEVEKRIEILLKKEDGSVQAEPFPAAEYDGGGDGEGKGDASGDEREDTGGGKRGDELF
jgi:exodeoxyribonuclease VII small subunit